MIKLNSEGFGDMPRVIGLLVVLTLCVNAGFYGGTASAYGYEVKFRGVAVSDESFGQIVAYGSYYCEATVKAVLYDPNSTLSFGDNVTVAYQNALSVKAGDEIECYGANCINCSICPKQYFGYVVCKPSPYYTIPEFPSVLMVFLLMATTLPAVILYRRRRSP
jgi:hypothetical protein